MRHIGMDSIRKVPIRQPSISDILEFQSETDRRQTTIFGHLHALFSLTDGQFMHSNALAVLIGQSKQLVNAERDRLGRRTT